MIDAPIISGASTAIAKAAPKAVEPKPKNDAGFRKALSSEIKVEPHLLPLVESHPVAAGDKSHRKLVGRKATPTKAINSAVDAAPNEATCHFDQQATPIVITLTPPRTQDPAGPQAECVMSDAASKQAAKLASQGNVPSIVSSKVSLPAANLVAPCEANAIPQVTDGSPEIKDVAAKAKPVAESAKTQSGVLNPPARIAGAVAPASVVAITESNRQTGDQHKSVQPDHVSAASPFTNAPVHVEEVKTLTATPNVLEIGVANVTHGWLRVRAELGHTGEVNASLVTTSSHAADALHNDLPAMAAYLATEQVGVSSVVVNPVAQGTGAQLLQGGAGSDSQAEKQRQEHRRADENPLIPDAAYLDRMTVNWGSSTVPAALHVAGGGGWLSVRV